MNMIKVLIVEDHTLLVDGLIKLLATQNRYQLVAMIDNGLDVYKACQEHEPDLVLLDLGLPGMNGIDVLHHIMRRWPNLKVVVMTAETQEFKAAEAFEAGALGYVLKKSSQQTLLAALHYAVVNRRFLDPELDPKQLTASRGEAQILTPRERQVLQLAAEGLRNREIAETLSISLKTVETHRQHIMQKLDAHHIGELINWARRLGLVK